MREFTMINENKDVTESRMTVHTAGSTVAVSYQDGNKPFWMVSCKGSSIVLSNTQMQELIDSLKEAIRMRRPDVEL